MQKVINFRFIIGFLVVCSLLAVVAGVWSLLGPDGKALSRAGINLRTRRKIVLLFVLVSGLLIAPTVLGLVFFSFPPSLSLFPGDGYTPSRLGFVVRHLSVHAAVAFLLALVFISIALLVTPRSWRKKVGWILLLMGFILDYFGFGPLTTKLTDVWHLEAFTRLSLPMILFNVPSALWLAAIAMFLIPERKRGGEKRGERGIKGKGGKYPLFFQRPNLTRE